MQFSISQADKYRKKLQVELEDANNALEQQKSAATERERQQRKYDQSLNSQKQEQAKYVVLLPLIYK